MTDILPLLKPLSPYIPQALAVLLIGALIFFRTFSREKEILSRMDKLSNTIENLYKKLETENEKIAQKIEDVNEKYHNIEKKLYREFVTKEEIKDFREEVKRMRVETLSFLEFRFNKLEEKLEKRGK